MWTVGSGAQQPLRLVLPAVKRDERARERPSTHRKDYTRDRRHAASLPPTSWMLLDHDQVLSNLLTSGLSFHYHLYMVLILKYPSPSPSFSSWDQNPSPGHLLRRRSPEDLPTQVYPGLNSSSLQHLLSSCVPHLAGGLTHSLIHSSIHMSALHSLNSKCLLSTFYVTNTLLELGNTAVINQALGLFYLKY